MKQAPSPGKLVAFMRWGISGIATLLLFLIGGFLAPIDSPPLPAVMIALVFLLLPLAVITPVVALRLRQCRPDSTKTSQPPWRYDPTGSVPAFCQMAGLASMLFGASALFRAWVLSEPIGVQFFFFGGGFAIFLGVVLFYTLEDRQRQ